VLHIPCLTRTTAAVGIAVPGSQTAAEQVNTIFLCDLLVYGCEKILQRINQDLMPQAAVVTGKR
jgi:hypothetical protein